VYKRQVKSIYQDFDCVVIYGRENNFRHELLHKQKLLSIALRSNPTWLCWFDSDAILGAWWEDRDRTEDTLARASQQNIDLIFLHNLNLWRDSWWYRTDQSYNDLWHGVFWRNTGQLHYKPVAKLHQKQYPFFYYDTQHSTNTTQLQQDDAQLLHFGFASADEIAKKYFTYRDNGQTGWALDRLVSEQKMINPQTNEEEVFTLEPAMGNWFPSWYDHGKPAEEPEPLFTPERMMLYGSYEQWKAAQ
jgi:hypothetical protein